MDGWLHAPYPIPPPPSGMQPTGPPLPGGTITYMVLDEFIPLRWGAQGLVLGVIPQGDGMRYPGVWTTIPPVSPLPA